MGSTGSGSTCPPVQHLLPRATTLVTRTSITGPKPYALRRECWPAGLTAAPLPPHTVDDV